MKPSLPVLAVLLLNGCDAKVEVQKPEPVAEVAVAAEVAEAQAPKPEPAPEPEVEPEPPKKKKPLPLTHGRCQKLNRQFIQCGWKCVHRGGDVGYCVNSCSHFLTNSGRRCLHTWGPGFG